MPVFQGRKPLSVLRKAQKLSGGCGLSASTTTLSFYFLFLPLMCRREEIKVGGGWGEKGTVALVGFLFVLLLQCIHLYIWFLAVFYDLL